MDSAPPTEFISTPLLVGQEADKRADSSAECPVCVAKPSRSKAKPMSPVIKLTPPTRGGGRSMSSGWSNLDHLSQL